MALNKSNFLIRDYENIREILRDIYIYGCFSRDDFIEKGISGRKYDNEKRRINAYLPNDFIKNRRVNKKVLQYCKYSMTDSANNYLMETFRNKSFTALDILSHFFVMQLLNQKEQFTLSELLKQMHTNNKEIIFTKDNLRNKLEEMQQNGLIQKSNRGYSLAEDIWKDFSTEELLEIHTLLEFMKNVYPLEMPYYFLQRRLNLYLRCERDFEEENYQTMLFKHNHFFNSIDNDILLEILSAISGKKKIVVFIKKKMDYMKVEERINKVTEFIEKESISEKKADCKEPEDVSESKADYKELEEIIEREVDCKKLEEVIEREVNCKELEKTIENKIYCKKLEEVIEKKVDCKELEETIERKIGCKELEEVVEKKEEIEIKVIPIKIVHDSIYGRQYLVSYNELEEKVSVFRIDRIKRIRIEDEAEAGVYQKAMQECERDKECWSITEVKVEFLFDEDKEKFIFQRIQREGHGGKIEKLADGRYLYTILVRDPIEMIPWIRSFGERAKVLSSGTFQIEKLIEQEFRKAAEKYRKFLCNE